jgi:HPt (histidine-containing phosphotransfer) domain-containing protein
MCQTLAELPLRPGGVIDREQLLRTFGDDPPLIAEMITMFQSSSVSLLAEIEAAATAGDAAALSRHAHSLKGTVSMYSRGPARELSLRLELMGSAGMIESANETVVELRDATGILLEELHDLLAMIEGADR